MPSGTHTLTVALHPGDAERIDTGPVLALDADAWASCTARGLDTIGPSHLTGYREQQAACAQALLAAFRACSDTDSDQIHPLRAVSYRHVRWTNRVASIAAAVSCAVQDTGVGTVRTLDRASGHAMDRPVTETRMPVLNGAAAAGACFAGASHITLSAGSGLDDTTSDASTAAALSQQMAGPLGDHALVIADGADLARLLPLRTQMEEAAEAPLVFVSHDPEPHPDALPVHAYAGTPDGEGHLETSARSRFIDHCAGAGGLAHAIVTHSGFASHLDFVFGPYAQRVARNIARWDEALRARAPKAVIGTYHSVGLDVAGHLGLPTILLPHGPMLLGADEYTRSIAPGVLAGAVGAAHAERTRSLLGESHPIVETGVLGVHDAAAILPATNHTPHLLIPTGEATRPAHLGEPPVSLFDREADAIRRLVNGLCARGWSVTVRNHPRYDRGDAFYRAATSGVPAGAVKITSAAEASLEEALARSDAAAFMSAPSSAMLEIARTGVPVLLLTESWGPNSPEQWGLAGLPNEPTAERAIERLAPLAESGEPRDAARRSLDARSAGAALLADRAVERTMDAIRSLAHR